MEIKKIGFEIDSWSQEVECKNCQTKLSIYARDLRTYEKKRYYVYCAACNDSISIESLHVLLKQFVDKNGEESYYD